MKFYEELQAKVGQLVQDKGLQGYPVEVKGKVLKAEEAIGKPERRDFPLLQGKELMVEAEFQGHKGQAFTSEPQGFQGTIEEILIAPLRKKSSGEMAVFIATLNAVMSYLGMAEKMRHCSDEEPERCSRELCVFLKEKYGDVRVGMVGYQPAMVDHLHREFTIRVLDLNPGNIGKIKNGVLIEDGEKSRDDVTQWADLLLVTGSTVVNGTIEDYSGLEKPVLFYGNTIAGTAVLMGLERVCFCGK
ncbi:MAG: DUF364 domain-containing protein [Syntrophaceticus schinkii]|jgi:hypothetical protein